MSSRPRIRVGVSGWRYPPWRGTFYPKGLPQRSELAYAATRLDTLEINGTFYSLQRPDSFDEWYRQTPEDFLFALKGPRYITHMRRLKEVEQPLANWWASGIFNLRHKLGPVLWQFPANFHYDPGRLREFIEQLPRDTGAAARQAKKRAAFMRGRDQTAFDTNRPLRYAIEIRHPSFATKSFIDLLREHNIALVVSEGAHEWPMLQAVTANFVYLRLHGDRQLYRSGYSPRALGRWASRIAAWHQGPRASRARDVFCFFDNTDAKLRAPFDAQALRRLLALRSIKQRARAHAPRDTA